MECIYNKKHANSMREMFCVSNIAFHVNCNVSDNSCKAYKSVFFSNRDKRIIYFIKNASQILSIVSDQRPHSTLPQTFVIDMKFMYTQKLIYLQINILTYLNLIMKLQVHINLLYIYYVLLFNYLNLIKLRPAYLL